MGCRWDVNLLEKFRPMVFLSAADIQEFAKISAVSRESVGGGRRWCEGPGLFVECGNRLASSGIRMRSRSFSTKSRRATHGSN